MFDIAVVTIATVALSGAGIKVFASTLKPHFFLDLSYFFSFCFVFLYFILFLICFILFYFVLDLLLFPSEKMVWKKIIGPTVSDTVGT